MSEPFNIIAPWATQYLGAGLFYFLAFLAIAFSYGVLFDGRIIRCGFLLIGVFGTISALFMLLEAQFLAMAQLMIYAVGITLVVVIALMLTNPRMEVDAEPASVQHRLPAVLTAIAIFLVIYLGVRSEIWAPRATEATASPDNVLIIGKALLGYYSLPFEFASVLLLIALVGAIMLAKSDHGKKPETWIIETHEEIEGRKADVAKV